MNKTEILSQLSNSTNDFKKLGVNRIALFGSYAKGTEHKKSDIDLFVEFNPEKETYDNFISLCFYLDKLFTGKKVEVVTKGGVSPYIEPEILKYAAYA